MTSREENQNADVFARLGAGTQDPVPGGQIREWNGRPKLSNPLNCTHVIEGHSNSVWAVRINGNNLYTAAAGKFGSHEMKFFVLIFNIFPSFRSDRTVRIWDLGKANGPIGLLSHAGPVVAIEYDRKSQLLFSASGAFVRVWDLRTNTARAIKTLCSSGNTLSGHANVGLTQAGETPITALSIGASGNLYMAASDKVRIWDLRNFMCTGKLIGGHQAAVMCVASWEGSNNTDFVATGSKDHYVKVFEVPSSGGIVSAKSNYSPLLHLDPPHYDGK